MPEVFSRKNPHKRLSPSFAFGYPVTKSVSVSREHEAAIFKLLFLVYLLFPPRSNCPINSIYFYCCIILVLYHTTVVSSSTVPPYLLYYSAVVPSLGVVGNLVPLWAEEAVVDALHGSEDLGVAVAVERRVAAKKDEHDDPNRPQITRLVVLLGQN